MNVTITLIIALMISISACSSSTTPKNAITNDPEVDANFHMQAFANMMEDIDASYDLYWNPKWGPAATPELKQIYRSCVAASWARLGKDATLAEAIEFVEKSGLGSKYCQSTNPEAWEMMKQRVNREVNDMVLKEETKDRKAKK